MTLRSFVPSSYAPAEISEKYAMEMLLWYEFHAAAAWQRCAMASDRSTGARPSCATLWRVRTFAGRRAAVRYADKIVTREQLVAITDAAHAAGRRVVFTNGCFDLLHVGHVRYLAAARDAGDLLVVGLNDDASVRRLKGPSRPVVPEAARAEVVAALAAVDYVTLFSEDTPLELITAVQPDVLVKGSDWAVDRVIGRDVVEARGGRVLLVPVVAGFSTTALADRLANR
jgi:D-beta-D-heptose 7-phosphate kinase/D-beta-D-heptose 1-phosphate adenosyltransferase